MKEDTRLALAFRVVARGRRRVVRRAEDLDHPLPSADTVLKDIVLKSLTPMDDLIACAERINTIYEEALAEGDDSSSAIAGKLGVSERTLLRRLQELGYQHRELQRAARFHRARKLLAERDMDIAEVGRQTGFSDVSGFSRAFRRWAYRCITSCARCASRRA